MQLTYNSRIAVQAVVAFLFLVILIIVTDSRFVEIMSVSLSSVRQIIHSKTKEMNYLNKLRGTNRSLTVVTAYFDIGSIPKGSLSNMRTPDKYKSWMAAYRYLQNPLIIYTDSQNFTKFFRDLRRETAAPTKIIQISRNSLWSFQIKPKIAQIYAKPGYPKYYPITYVPEFTSVMHSKLTVVANAIHSKLFPSDYYCWLDIGYFRDLVGRRKEFYAEVPDDFNKSRIGVTRVYDVDLSKVTAKDVILGKRNWIGGGLFLGKPDTFLKFESQYKNRVMYYLSQELMGDDQCILYAMNTKSERQKHPIAVEVQTYIPGTKHAACGDPWFYLGCLMYHEVTNKSNATSL